MRALIAADRNQNRTKSLELPSRGMNRASLCTEWRQRIIILEIALRLERAWYATRLVGVLVNESAIHRKTSATA
jgi:hypothetical protein